MNLQTIIEKKIVDQLSPQFLNVENESSQHAVPKDSETHFKVTVVSDAFHDMRLLQRHRLINQLLSEELSGPVHALALHTCTPEEWSKRNGLVRDSAQCLGQSK
ncbi:BolA family protein [Psychromonas sp. PT13]|uniref:BolA family protein n=1 Tax=Psychromonas sp. PT13 TaxID=3439547 RepID=UPI003EC02383